MASGRKIRWHASSGGPRRVCTSSANLARTLGPLVRPMCPSRFLALGLSDPGVFHAGGGSGYLCVEQELSSSESGGRHVRLTTRKPDRAERDTTGPRVPASGCLLRRPSG